MKELNESGSLRGIAFLLTLHAVTHDRTSEIIRVIKVKENLFIMFILDYMTTKAVTE